MPAQRNHLPALVAHADWSKDASKRWIAKAVRRGRSYAVVACERVGALPSFIDRLRSNSPADGSVLIGFDFPIGLPAAYASRAGIDNFPDWLSLLGSGRWGNFANLATTRDEISIERPFYPFAPGGTMRQHLIDGLGLEGTRDLYRLCELATPDRRSASPLFWTLGAKQVGRAALAGWIDLIVPLLRSNREIIDLWPFDGNLSKLIRGKRVVIAETYPAEGYRHIGFPTAIWSKRDQEDRRRCSEDMKKWFLRRGVDCERDVLDLISDGFGPRPDGEDPFDAVVGLLSMLEVTLGFRPDGAPSMESVKSIEGWILGQKHQVR